MKRIIALDYGERKIGVAVSDEARVVAMPLCVIRVESRRQVLAAVRRICMDRDAGRIIVGMPLNMNGTRGPQSENVSRLVKQLEDLVGIPVETWDERMSTKAAERALIDCNVGRGRRKQVVDKLAARFILQSYLDAGSDIGNML